MPSPRKLALLRKLALRNKVTVLLAPVVLGGIFVSFVWWEVLVGYVTSVGLLLVILLYALWLALAVIYALRDVAPSTFSLSERVKFYLDALARRSKEYGEAYADPRERRRVARRCRAISGSLLQAVGPYASPGKVPTDRLRVSDPNYLDLFVSDLTAFSDRIVDLASLVSDLPKADVRQLAPASLVSNLPGAEVRQPPDLAVLNELVSLLDQSSGPQPGAALTMLVTAQKSAAAAGLVLDPDMGLDASQRALSSARRRLLALAPRWKVALAGLLISGAYGGLVLVEYPFFAGIGAGTTILIYLGLLGTAFTFYLAAR